MDFSPQLFQTPYPWFLISAFFLGGSLSRMTRPIRPTGAVRGNESGRIGSGRTPEAVRVEMGRNRAVSWKWTVASLGLTVSILLALGGVFVPGAEKLRDLRLLYLYIGAVPVAVLMFRFKKAFGLPLILLLISVVIVFMLFIRSIVSFTGETEIARVRVLKTTGSSMKLEIIRPDKDGSDLVDLKGEYFAPIVKLIIFDDLLVFLGTSTWYRFVGLTSFRLAKDGDNFKLKQEDTDYYFPHASGISESLFGLFEKYEAHIPGIKSVQIDMSLKRPNTIIGEEKKDLDVFSVRIQNDGGIQIVREN